MKNFDFDKIEETANKAKKAKTGKTTSNKKETSISDFDTLSEEKIKLVRVRESWHRKAKVSAKKRRMTLQYYLEYLIEKDKP